MNFDFSDDQKLLRDQARKFLTDKCDRTVVRSVLENSQKNHSDDLWKEISAMGWTGTAIPEAPTPNPPRNRKIAKVMGSFAKADPIAETVYNPPTHISVFFLPNLWVGIAPKRAPTTVPHKAIAITTLPWKASDEFHKLWSFLSAPEITTVSNPNNSPAIAATSDQKNTFLIKKLIF